MSATMRCHLVNATEIITGLAESNGSLPPGGWLRVTCELTACTPGSAPYPTLSNEYRWTLPFLFWHRLTSSQLISFHSNWVTAIGRSHAKWVASQHTI